MDAGMSAGTSSSRASRERGSVRGAGPFLGSWHTRVWALTALLCVGCEDEPVKEKATARIYVEDAEMERVEGQYRHEFTLINGNNLPITTATVRFHYKDRDGNEVGTADAKFNAYLEAHDAVRKINVDGGPVIDHGELVTYEVVKAKTTLVRRETD